MKGSWDGRQTFNTRMPRRQFLRATAVAAGGFAMPRFVPGSVLGADGTVAPSERITAALLGRGLMGRGHLSRLVGDPGVHVIGVCDPDRSRCQEGARLVDETYASRYGTPVRETVACSDHRELLDRADLDAVVIASPDHWHARQSIDAARAGKDVYCEKPVSLTIEEGRRLVEAVSRYGRVFQTGSQYRSIPAIRTVCEFVRRGGLGQVKSAFTIWSNLHSCLASPRFRPYAQIVSPDQLGRSNIPLDFPLPAEPVPDGLDWEQWVGPAAWRDYNPLYHINPAPGVVPWSFCEDFGAASVTWHHSHSADVIQYALGQETSGPVEILHPSDGEFPTLTYRYANGTLLHLVEHWGIVRDVYRAVPANARLAGLFGGVFVGERGWLTSMSTGGRIEGEPESLFQEMELENRDPQTGANNHHRNWFDCIRSRQRPSSHEEIGHRSAALGHLAIIAYRLQRSLKWDPVKEEFPDDEQANRLCCRAKREAWPAGKD
jgi:hypothetical protein